MVWSTSMVGVFLMLLGHNHVCIKRTFLGLYTLKAALLISFTLQCTWTFELLFYSFLMSPQTLKKHNVILVHRGYIYCNIFVIVFWYSNLGIPENSVIVVKWLTPLKGLPQLFTGQCSLSIPPENIRKLEIFCFQGYAKKTLAWSGLITHHRSGQ